MTFARTALVAAAVVATTVAADGVTISALCAQDCTNCTDVTPEFTSGTTVCTAGATTAVVASSLMCVAEANTCIGTTSYSDDACTTATIYTETVCNKCVAISTTGSVMITCSKGSSDLTYAVYSEAADCTGTQASISISASCASPLGTYMKVTTAGYGCNVYASQTHATNECSSDVSTPAYAARTVCQGSLVTDTATMAKVSCPGNDDASSASFFSAAAAAVVAILCVVA